MTAPDFTRAIRAAYRMRLYYDPADLSLSFDPFLPMSVERDLRVCKYMTFCKMHHMDAAEFLSSVSPDGFTLREGNHYIILYNDAPHIPETRKRFTLAHELGHYTLRHRRDGEKEEQEANCFARNLLAPRLFAITHGIDFPDYPRAFNISAAAARMCELKQDLDMQVPTDVFPIR